ncbi:hypothetical protein BDV18DRAFT_155415 [Aspergillus unguis]
MPHEYAELCRICPRSFLFAIVANVDPGRESRTLAVAYRQGDNHVKETHMERVNHFVEDTLALIEVLSDPTNRAPLEAEMGLARDWYWKTESQAAYKKQYPPRHSVPDSVQPSYTKECLQRRPQLPWRDDAPTKFPFTTTCLLLGLLGDNVDGTRRSRTRPGDVQLQPLSTLFLGECIEYGLVVVDISDLDSGVKYGISAFPVCYMTDVLAPEKEPDVVPFSPRRRELLSIRQWLSRYFHCDDLSNQPSLRRLDSMPLASRASLDYIWPRQTKIYMNVFGGSPPASWGDVICDIFKTFIWPSKRIARIKKRLTTRSTAETAGNTASYDPSRDKSFDWAEDDSTTSSITISDDPPHNIPKDIDRIIDDLLVLTHKADEHLESSAVDNLQILAKFPEQLREQLEENPDRLGPSKLSAQVLAVAYAGRRHLNWTAFWNLTPSVITAAVASDELRGASALSFCVDQFELEDVKELIAVSQCTGIRQLCLVQRRDRDSDDSSPCSYSELLVLWQRRVQEERGGLKWNYASCAFSTSLRSPECLPSVTIARSLASHAPILPTMHMFTFGNYQGPDGPYVAEDVQPYQKYYTMNTNTQLDAESFAVRFLAYLSFLSSSLNPEKAILKFAYNGASSSSSDPLGVIPIPAGFFDFTLPPDHRSRVRLGDLQADSWVILVGYSGQTSCYTTSVPDTPSEARALHHPDTRQPSANMDAPTDDTILLHYSFVKIRQHEQMPIRSEVVGGLADFLRETVPESDISAWEIWIWEMELEMRLRTRRASIGPGDRSIGIGVMDESRARALLELLL